LSGFIIRNSKASLFLSWRVLQVIAKLKYLKLIFENAYAC
jgi:hypothetical protein